MNTLIKSVTLSALVSTAALAASAQTMDITMVRTGSNNATGTQHYRIQGTANGSFSTGSARSWGNSIITFRIPNTIRLAGNSTITVNSDVSSGNPSTTITNPTTAFTAFGYTDQWTGNPVSQGLTFYSLTDLGAPADDGYKYVTLNSTSALNQSIANGGTVSILEFDLPREWGLGACPDCMNLVTTNPAVLNGIAQINSQVTNASVNNGQTNIATFNNNIIAPLPVKLLSFEARKVEGNRTQLNWQTAMEQGADYFEVERSLDGKSFDRVVRHMLASGNSAVPLDYQTYDNEPAGGNNYYRLKMVDASGKSSYSEVRVVNFGSVRSYSSSPNPATDVLNVKGMDKGATIMILSTTGQLIHQVTAGGNAETVQLSDMVPGMYYVQIVENGAIVYNQKFVKQ